MTLLSLDVDSAASALKAGFPLHIVAPDKRKAVMELAQGRVQYRAVDGEFSERETRLVAALMNQAQAHFESAADKEGP